MGINTPALRAYVLNPIGIIYTGASPPYRCRKIGSARKIPKNDFQNSFLKWFLFLKTQKNYDII